MDLYTLPVKTLVQPFIISSKNKRGTGTISVDQQFLSIVGSHPDYKVQIRGIRLSKEMFKNTWPNFSSFRISPGPFKKTFDLPEREQSRKRKDTPLDLRDSLPIKSPKSYTLTVDFLPNSTHQIKNEDYYSYVIAVFLVVPVKLEDLTSHYTKFGLFKIEQTLSEISKEFNSYTSDDLISDEIRINLM